MIERGSATLLEHIFSTMPGISSGPHALLIFILARKALILEGLKSISNSLSVPKLMSVLYSHVGVVQSCTGNVGVVQCCTVKAQKTNR